MRKKYTVGCETQLLHQTNINEKVLTENVFTLNMDKFQQFKDEGEGFQGEKIK